MMITLQKKLDQIAKLVDVLESVDCNASKYFLDQLSQMFSGDFLHNLTENLVKDKEYILLQNVLPIISEVNSDSVNELAADNIGSTQFNGGDAKQLDLLPPLESGGDFRDAKLHAPPAQDTVLNGVNRTSETIQIITLKVFSRCSGITRTQSYFPVRRRLEENNLIEKEEFYEEVSTYVNEEKRFKTAFYHSYYKCHKLIDSAIESLLRKKWLSYGSTEKTKNKPICITQEGLDYLKMLEETISEVKA